MMSDNVQESLVGAEMGGTEDDWCAPSVSAAEHINEGTNDEFILPDMFTRVTGRYCSTPLMSLWGGGRGGGR